MEFAFFYIEANIVSIIILAILFLRSVNNVDRQLTQIEFLKTVATFILLFLIDIIWMCFESGIIKSTAFFTHSIYFILFTFLTFASMQWFIYSEIAQGNTAIYKLKKRIPWAIPFFVVFITFFCFTIYLQVTNKIVKIRYRLVIHWLMVILSCFYAFVSSIRSFIRAGSKDNKVYKGFYIHMGIYPLLLITAIIFQLSFTHAPILCFVCTLIMLYFYFNGVDKLISIDPLTKLNNRNQLYRYFHQLQKLNDDKLYLLIIDIDDFKSINDTYGHLEGDNALKLVADSFIQVCSNYPYKHFIARYGGDEFIIIAGAEHKKEIEELKVKLEKKVFLNSVKSGAPYELGVSIGFARVKKKNETIEECLKKADSALYLEKKEKYALREEVKTSKIRKLNKYL